MKNVTISLANDLALWLRVRAAEEDMSISRFLARLLEDKRHEEDVYRAAMTQALSVEPRMLRESAATPLPKRAELYDR